MANTYLLSDESKHYLNCYYQILDEMIQGITTAKLTRSLSHNFISCPSSARARSEISG